jgi:hypothetical protein
MLLTDKYDEISEYSLNISDYDRKFCVEKLKMANLLTVDSGPAVLEMWNQQEQHVLVYLFDEGISRVASHYLLFAEGSFIFSGRTKTIRGKLWVSQRMCACVYTC